MTAAAHPAPSHAHQLDLVFGALADATRRTILQRLTSGEVSVADLTAGFTISQPAISKHLRVLERAGLISRSRRGTARLSRLEAAPLEHASDWLSSYREYWESRFDRLEQVLAEERAAAAPGAAAADDEHGTRPATLTTDPPTDSTSTDQPATPSPEDHR